MNEKKPLTPTLGAAIREARKKLGWSQGVLSERAGVSRPTIARVEAGHDISTASLSKVTSALGLTVTINEVRGLDAKE
jgi:transcriptional regulator with XRE-family HTH domain